MELTIPNTFDNYQQRMLSLGLETKSETSYKGYIIILRCYYMSGISSKIVKLNKSNKRLILIEKHYIYCKPLDLLNKSKEYIDNHEINLINKFNNHYKNK